MLGEASSVDEFLSRLYVGPHDFQPGWSLVILSIHLSYLAATPSRIVVGYSKEIL